MVDERGAEVKKLEWLRSRVDELQSEQKTSYETIGQLSAQRTELERARNQQITDMNELRKVGRT